VKHVLFEENVIHILTSIMKHSPCFLD